MVVLTLWTFANGLRWIPHMVGTLWIWVPPLDFFL